MPEPAHPHPDDVDPTGIRELLAALPDPGPMPEDLVHRIEARLEVEQAAGAHPAPHPLGRHADRVVDLAGERSRRRPARTLAVLGAAAVGLVATAMVVPQLIGPQGGGDAGTAAHYPSRDDGDTRGDARDDADTDGGGEEEAEGGTSFSTTDRGEPEDATGESLSADDGEVAADGAADLPAPAFVVPLDGELVLLGDLGPVDQQDLTRVTRLALEEADRSGAQAPAAPGTLTEGEGISCWRQLADEHSFDRYVAATAELLPVQGQRQPEPVVALLGVDEDGAARSWVLPHSCTHDPDVVPVLEGVPHD